MHYFGGQNYGIIVVPYHSWIQPTIVIITESNDSSNYGMMSL